MQAVANGSNIRFNLRDTYKICSLSDDCLTITCGRRSMTTIRLSPCEPAVFLSGSLFNYGTYKFTRSEMQYVPYRLSQDPFILMDVTLVELQDGGAVGLQVGE